MYIFIEWIWFMVFKLLDDKDCLIFVFLEIGKVSIGVYGNVFFWVLFGLVVEKFFCIFL